jgi:hypothetical protein
LLLHRKKVLAVWVCVRGREESIGSSTTAAERLAFRTGTLADDGCDRRPYRG